MTTYFYTFLFALVAAFVLTPVMRRLAIKIGAVDYPDARKVHSQPIPYLGGVAIYLAFVISVVFVYGFFSGFQIYSSLPALLLACLIIVILGLYDDLRGSSARVKFLAQTAAALIVIYSGVRIQEINIPIYDHIELGVWAWPVTCLWLVGLCNAVNLIDGLDGLAAGICMFAALSIFASSVRWGGAEVALLCSALVGSLLGFLRYNFHPARIFMGDTGALLLGFLLGVISILAGSKSTSGVAILIPITAMGIPILDTSAAIFRRLRKHQRLFLADREHLHHRLMRIGLSHRQAVLLMYLASLYLGIISFVMTFLPPHPRAILFGILLVSGMLILRRWSRLYRASTNPQG